MATVELTLTGPDGANPLGFLCALGALRTLSNAWPDSEVKMKWEQIGAAWRPVLRANHADLDGKDEADQRDVIVNAIFEELKKMEGHPAFAFKDKDGNEWVTTEVGLDEYQRYAREATAEVSSLHLRWMEFVAAFACESLGKSSAVQDTEFRFLGGGKQRFMVAIRNLVANTQPRHLLEAMFGPWRYEDPGDGNIALRWDPADDRRHALRWTDPTQQTTKVIQGKKKSSKIWTVIGANRLAVEALPLYPAFPASNRLATTGFKGGRRDGKFWTWPMWDAFLNVEAVRSVLAISELQADQPDRAVLAPRGVVEIHRAQKIGVGNYKNFTPVQPV